MHSASSSNHMHISNACPPYPNHPHGAPRGVQGHWPAGGALAPGPSGTNGSLCIWLEVVFRMVLFETTHELVLQVAMIQECVW